MPRLATADMALFYAKDDNLRRCHKIGATHTTLASYILRGEIFVMGLVQAAV